MKSNNRSGLGLARVSMGEVAALLAKYNALPDDEWDRMRQEQMDMGWGSTETANIPANWREVRGPECALSAEVRAMIGRKVRAAKNRKLVHAGSGGV